VKAGEAVLTVAGAAANPPDKSRSKAWYAVDEAISSSFAKRSQLFDISSLVIVR